MANEPRLATESIAGQRPYQEDAVLAETLDDGRVLVAVADGMGGHAAGEVASALALEALREAVGEGKSLAEAFTLANSRVYQHAKEPGKQGMGTTLVAALVNDGEVQWANVGDSRGYVISANGIEQLTEDHSFVAEAVKRGQSEAEAMAGPWKDALTRSIGTEEGVDVDVFGPIPLAADSALVVCSDGLYKTLSNADLLSIYEHSVGPRGAAQSLVSTAFEKGSDDNITVAVAEYGEVRRIQAGGTVPLNYDPSSVDEAEAAETETVDAETVEADTEASDDRSGEGGREADRSAADSSPGASGGSARPTPATMRARASEVDGSVGSSIPLPAIVGAVVVVAVLLGLLVFG